MLKGDETAPVTRPGPRFQEERDGKDGRPPPLTPPPFSGPVIWAVSGRLVTPALLQSLLLSTQTAQAWFSEGEGNRGKQ